jgi:hypothetical protein
MLFKNQDIYQILRHTFRDILHVVGNTMIQSILKYNNKYKCYAILKQGYPLFFCNYNLNLNFKILKQFLHQLEAMASAIQRYMI